MNINRNNYEEYFLLYADKELSSDQKTRVEKFVQENPDLEEEFVMLHQSVIRPDKTIQFEDKNSLLREESNSNAGNIQEKILLYTDNELPYSEIKELEKFLLMNPALQNEFNLLQKVTYEPDTSIVFPDKKLLYRKEDEHKVIPFPWRYLAAAILLGIGLWIGLPYLQKNNSKPAVAVEERIPEKKSPLNVPETKENKKDQLVKNDDKLITPEPGNFQGKTNLKKPQENLTVKSTRPVDKIPEVNNPPVKKQEMIVVADVPDKSTLTNGLPKPINKIPEPNSNTVTTPDVEMNSKVIPASYMEDADAKSENYVFYNITAEEFRKSKIGNFLKRAKRSIAGKLSLRNGLKIGNVEIAKDDQN